MLNISTDKSRTITTTANCNKQQINIEWLHMQDIICFVCAKIECVNEIMGKVKLKEEILIWTPLVIGLYLETPSPNTRLENYHVSKQLN